MSFALVANLAISAIVLASVYALINVGFVVLYRTTGVINFAQGHFMLIGAYLMWELSQHLPYAVSLVLTVVALWVAAIVIYFVLMQFLLGAKEFTKVITTLMLATILLQIPAMIWGTSVHPLAPPTAARIELSQIVIYWSDVFIVVEAIVVVLILTFVVNRTVTGIRMRGLASDENLAIFAGIRVHRMAAIAWGLAGAGAALAGIAYGQRSGVGLSIPSVGFDAFPAVVIGGLDSIGGSLAGGVVVATIQTVATYFLGAVYGDILAYVVMLGVLMVRPTGLYGSAAARRV